MLICIFDDRAHCEPALRVLVASLYRHSPQLAVRLIHPPASPAFREWLKSYPNVALHTAGLPTGLGWNIKPLVLMQALDDGHDNVVWVDSDIVVTKDIAPVFAELNEHELVITEEALWGEHSDANARRAVGWGFEVGRQLPFTLNTGVVRVTPHHRDLLEAWLSCLQTDEYRGAQRIALMQRPTHLIGDQDVLTALLSWRAHSDIPLRILARGEGILQIFGLKAFTTAERWQCARRGLPAFVHSQQFKPWLAKTAFSSGVTGILEAAYLDTSPYTMVARDYRKELTDDHWMRARTPLGKLLRALGFGYIPATGLPLGLAFDAIYAVAAWAKRIGR